MSDDKRKNARTQGRFTSEKEIRPNRREKEKQKAPKSHSDSVNGSKSKDAEKEKVQDSASRAADGFSLKYQEGSQYSFKELEPQKKPVEIRNSGAHQLSSTENGISRIIYEPDFISEDEADELMTILRDSTQWYDKNIIIHGKEVPQPRLVAWYGPFTYSYSGAVLEQAEMPSVVLSIKSRVEDNLKKHNLDVVLNSVLMNLYRNEKDGVAWHSDDEISMGICPTIASVSLGSVRKFEMRPKAHAVEQDSNLDADNLFFVNLKPGSLLIMDGCMQKDWQHRVPKEYHDRPPRINLTFRTVFSIDKQPSEPSLPTSKTSRVSSYVSAARPVFDGSDLDSWPSLGEPTNKSIKSSSLSENSKSNDKGAADNLSATQVENHSPDIDEIPDLGPIGDLVDTEDVDEIPDSGPIQDLEDTDCAVPQVPFAKPSTPDLDRVPIGASSSSQPDVLVGCVSEESCQNDSLVLSSHGEPSVPTLEANENKYQLNANAPDFIPKNLSVSTPTKYNYEKMEVLDLADLYVNNRITTDKLAEFQSALFSGIQKVFRSYFTARDRLELEVLMQLSDGTQTETNNHVILARLCSMTQNAYERQIDPNFSPARSYLYRNSQRGEYTQSRFRTTYNRSHSRR